MIYRVKAAFPYASVYATTLREVVSTNEHLWGAIMLAGEEWQVIKPRPIHVLDRIGGGDGFVGGLLYGILKRLGSRKMASIWVGHRCIGNNFPDRLCSAS